MTSDYLALDVGQTGLRGVIRTGNTDRLLEDQIGAPAVVNDAAVAAYVQRIQQAVGNCPMVSRAVIGTTGYPEADRLSELLLERLRSAIAAHSVTVASDRVTGFLGSVDQPSGVALTWGAGVVAFGVDGNRHVRVDGRGHALGDEGGGYWIGHRGLVEALNWFDGRGGSKLLAREASIRLGAPDDIYRSVYVPNETVAYVARFTPAVVAAATAGDSHARAILRQAVPHAAHTVTSAVDQLPNISDRVQVGLTGGLASVDMLCQRLCREIANALPDCTIRVVPTAHVDGAVRLAIHPELGCRFAGLVRSSEGESCST